MRPSPRLHEFIGRRNHDCIDALVAYRIAPIRAVFTADLLRECARTLFVHIHDAHNLVARRRWLPMPSFYRLIHSQLPLSSLFRFLFESSAINGDNVYGSIRRNVNQAWPPGSHSSADHCCQPSAARRSAYRQARSIRAGQTRPVRRPGRPAPPLHGPISRILKFDLPGQQPGLQRFLQHKGIHGPRRDCVHLNIERAQLFRQGFGQAHDAAFEAAYAEKFGRGEVAPPPERLMIRP